MIEPMRKGYSLDPGWNVVRVGIMMEADTTERLMAWENPQKPPLRE